MLIAVILTKNEDVHIERCIKSLLPVCSKILIVDSGSTDTTIDIIKKYDKIEVIYNDWINYSKQFNFALNYLKEHNYDQWVLRIDADEYLSNELADAIKLFFVHDYNFYNCVYIPRLIIFNNQPLFKGGLYPILHIKIFKIGFGICQDKWMDERIEITDEKSILLNYPLIDHNLNTITWWSEKHLHYAIRESIDYFNQFYEFYRYNTSNDEPLRQKYKSKYNKMPLFFRVFLYFFYRMFLKLAIFSTKSEILFTFLHSFWYRLIVDIIIYDVKCNCKTKEDIIQYYTKKYKINIF